jgi:ribosomal protein S18 acetylase RimI-like enzyme
MTPELNPLPAGFTARPLSLDDVQICFELFNTASQHLSGDLDIADPEILRNDWQDPKFNPQTNARLVFAPNGDLAGYVEVWDTGTPPVHPWVWMAVHPRYEWQGLEEILLAWGEARAALALERVPDGVRFAPRVGFVSLDTKRRSLVEAHGFQYTRSFYRMEVVFQEPPQVPPAPQGITIRPYNPETELEAVVQTMVDSFRDHYGFVERPFEEEMTSFRHHFLGDPLYDPNLWFVAMDGDEMAGICLCRRDGYEKPELGFVNELGVRREWRRRGIAEALLRTSFAAFAALGKQGAALGVDASSLTGATRLYEKAGMHPARQFDNFEKELRPGKEISTQTL